ncbi:MAG: hypothetical protein BEN19_04330 [Epulopiscium sp. Nuni2H_MBin003]|nr:MAG: hypothetical protein BEN19_04330 [Epulopiscium sp. Nuni2H_MBin003]
MGKIIYEPTNEQQDKKVKLPTNVKEESINAEERYSKLLDSIESLRAVGDVDCEHIVYIEDYAYTYMYQYARTNLSVEQAALIVGEYYNDTKEAIITGIIPIRPESLGEKDLWINEKAIKDLMEEKEQYFGNSKILGWLHMQPGYGTMVSSKEISVHRDLFPEKYSLLLLVDPINKVETFFVYDEETLKEQTGYYVYYDKNPMMQHYMLEKPFIVEKEETRDSAVKQFREIGNRRRDEYNMKQKTNFSVIAGCLALLALGAVFARFTGDDSPFSQDAQAVFNPGEQTENVYTIEKDSSMQIVQNETDSNIVSLEAQQEVPDITLDLEQALQVLDNPESNILEEENEVIDNIISTEVPEINNSVQEEVVQEEEVVETASTDVSTTDEFEIYVVEEGDTIRSISKKYFGAESYVLDILEWSGLEIADGDKIYVGQKLKIRVE